MSLNFSAKEIYGDRNTGERKEYPLIHNAESLQIPVNTNSNVRFKINVFPFFLSRRAVQYPEEAK